MDGGENPSFLRKGRPLLVFCFCIISAIHGVNGQEPFWRQTDGPHGGHIWKVVEQSPGHLFASTYSRLFKSTDSGLTWRTYLLDSMWVEGAQALCFDSGGRFYLGHADGVLVSTDEGETWSTTGYLPSSTSVRAIAFDSAGTLFAGTWRKGIFRSTDQGANWTRCTTDTITALAIYVDPVTNTILAGSERGIYRSTDGGSSWEKRGGGSDSFYGFLKHASGSLFAIQSTNTGGLFVSTDDGFTWNPRNTPLRYCEALCSTASGRIIVGTLWGMYVSDDAGVTWSPGGLTGEYALALWTGDANRVYAGTGGGGIYVSTDEGDTWQESTAGVLGIHVNAIASDDAGNVYTAWHKKISRSSDFGATFEESFRSASDDVRTVAVDSKGNVFAIVMDTVFISTDHGASWKVACATGIWQPPWVLGVDPDDNLFTVTRSAAVYRSTDQGSSWANVRPAGGSPNYVNIAFMPDGTGFFNADGNFFRSTDTGLTWQSIAVNPPPGGSRGFCIDNRGVIFLGTNQGVLRSTDKGQSWSESNTGILVSDRWVRLIVAAGNDLFVNTASYYYPPGYTTYRSTDHGESWFRESSGLPNDFVMALRGTPSGHVYAGTQYCGVYRSQVLVSGVGPAAEPQKFALFQNYPNPFNPSTVIRYNLPSDAFVTLTICNVLGQPVETLVNERQAPGFHETLFHGEGHPSGVYLYRLRAGSSTETRRFLLLR